MKKREEISKEIFGSDFNCSQSVLKAFNRDFNLPDNLAERVSLGFGGGMAHTDGYCGAVTGAMIVLGLKYGDSKEETYSYIEKFMDEFKGRFGSLKCTELLGYNISKDRELEKARESDIFNSLCPNLVAGAVKIIENL